MKRIILALLLLLLPVSVYAALPADSVWEVRPTNGSNLNGACVDKSVVAGTTDYSQQDAAELALTDLAATEASGGTTLTSATGGFTDQMVGNCIRLNAGTNGTVGYYMITGYTNGNTVTIDRDITDVDGGDLANGEGKVGGATASVDSQTTITLSDLVASTHEVYIKNEAGWGEAVTTVGTMWIGYNSTRGDSPTGTSRPTLDRNSGSGDAVTVSSGLLYMINIVVREAAGDGIAPANSYQDNFLIMVNSRSTNNGGDGVTSNALRRVYARLVFSEVDNNSSHGLDLYQANSEGACSIYQSEAHDNSANGVSNCGAGISSYGSLYYDNGADAVSGSVANFFLNTVDGNTGANVDGIVTTGTSIVFVLNNIFSNNGGYGVNISATPSYGRGSLYQYNDYYNNSSGAINNSSTKSTDQTLDPQFADAANDNYSIGANLKAKGYGALPGGTSTSYLDMGAVQRQEPTGGGGVIIVDED